MKGFALGLALKQRRKTTRKSPIGGLEISMAANLMTNSCFLFLFLR